MTWRYSDISLLFDSLRSSDCISTVTAISECPAKL